MSRGVTNKLQGHFDPALRVDAGEPGLPYGFDSEFSDIVDYILRITWRIWEGRQVALCLKYYTANCPVYTTAGITIGAEEVTRATRTMLAGFPDRTLQAENIIWSRKGDRFHTSHRILTRMTNLGPSDMGPATGKGACLQVIAHCVVQDNRIIEEWLVRDNYLLAVQLGFDPLEVALERSRQPVQQRLADWLESEFRRVQSDTVRTPVTADGESAASERISAAIHNAWNADCAVDIRPVYDEEAILHVSRGRKICGISAITNFYDSFRNALSDLKVSIDHCCVNAPPDKGDCLALRWTLAGRHTGRDLFGEPGGAELVILGESQYRLENGRIVEEWMVYDELAVWTQIFRAAGKAASEPGNDDS